MAEVLERWTPLAGRGLLSLLYLKGGLSNVRHWSGNVAYVAGAALPLLPPRAFLALGILFELGGALLILVGLWTRLGALLLILFTALTLVYFHDYWAIADPQARFIATELFWRNLALIGGLF